MQCPQRVCSLRSGQNKHSLGVAAGVPATVFSKCDFFILHLSVLRVTCGRGKTFQFSCHIYFIFIYLGVPGLSCGTWDLVP